MARFTQGGSSGGGASLPQNLATTASPTFDKIYTTHNGDGTNVQVGDDAWIGDINSGNTVNIMGIQDATQGYISMGSLGQVIVGNDGSNNLKLNATAGNINLYSDGAAYIGDSLSANQILKRSDLNNIASTFAYGAFHDETSFGPYAANTEHSFSYQTTDMSNDVHIGGIDHEQIIMDRAGKFNIAFSAQFHQISSAGTLYIWLSKNGTPVPYSNSRVLITANSPEVITAWNFFVDAAAGDYYEIRWSSTSNQTQVQAVTGLTGTKPNIPSLILTVNQVG
jgi:hypothetical protein